MEIGSSIESMRYQFQLPLHEKAWKCISYCKEHYNRAKKYSLKHGENYLMIGHPRMDLINYDCTGNEDYIKIMKKAKGRKIVMYNPHFTIGEGDNWGTFPKYAMEIMKYFKDNNDIFLLYTPHPLLEQELIKKYDESFMEKYHKYINETSNIYYDNNIFYLNAIHISDILISDASSLVPEYLIYNKPIIYTKKENTSGFKNKELEELLYVCGNTKDVINNLQKLLNGTDTKRKIREEKVEEIFNFNKNVLVSKKIRDLILNSFRK